jgi:hypothetical protein
MLIGDTTLTLSSIVGIPATGTVLIENEVIGYTSVSGNQLIGATRGIQQTVAAAHSSAITVNFLRYPTLPAIFKVLILPGLNQFLSELGSNSTYLGALLTARQAANAAPGNAINTAVQ